jgi:hypothetical protein
VFVPFLQGEAWDCIMHDCMDDASGGSQWAWLYFIFFYVIVAFVTLNLFIAIILDNFSSIMRARKPISLLPPTFQRRKSMSKAPTLSDLFRSLQRACTTTC